MDLAPVVKTFVSAAVFPQQAPPHPPQSRLKANEDSEFEHLQGCGVWPGHGNLLAGGGVGLSPSLVAAEPLPTPCPATSSVCVSCRSCHCPSPWLPQTWSAVGLPLQLWLRPRVSAPSLPHGDACLAWGRTASFRISLCVSVYVCVHVCTCVCVFGAEGGCVQSMSVQQHLNPKSLSHLSSEQGMTLR